jgi:hypothetical protein
MSLIWSWVNGDSVCTKRFYFQSKLHQIREICASAIPNQGNFIDVNGQFSQGNILILGKNKI